MRAVTGTCVRQSTSAVIGLSEVAMTMHAQCLAHTRLIQPARSKGHDACLYGGRTSTFCRRGQQPSSMTRSDLLSIVTSCSGQCAMRSSLIADSPLALSGCHRGSASRSAKYVRVRMSPLWAQCSFAVCACPCRVETHTVHRVRCTSGDAFRLRRVGVTMSRRASGRPQSMRRAAGPVMASSMAHSVLCLISALR